MKIKTLMSILLLLISQTITAQTTENIFYTNGKIYVVVAVMSIIFVGIIVYLSIIDRRLKRTEKELKEKESNKGLS